MCDVDKEGRTSNTRGNCYRLWTFESPMTGNDRTDDRASSNGGERKKRKRFIKCVIKGVYSLA